MRKRNQKGFLIALCLCMLSLSGIYGVYQYQKGQTPTPEEQSAQLEQDQKETANSRGAAGQTEAKIETEEDVEQIGQSELAEAEQEDTQIEIAQIENGQAEEVQSSEELADGGELTAEEESVAAGSDLVESKALTFSADNHLRWPVDGDVLLNYSMDKSIYFSTLNQYKYHPAVVIAAELGSEVRSAARGKVVEIRNDEETGTTLTMELGNGYEAVYGQLADLTVEEGDTIEAGTLIGYVGEPTKYYTLEGSNLYFQLLKDDDPVNPMDFLE